MRKRAIVTATTRTVTTAVMANMGDQRRAVRTDCDLGLGREERPRTSYVLSQDLPGATCWRLMGVCGGLGAMQGTQGWDAMVRSAHARLEAPHGRPSEDWMRWQQTMWCIKVPGMERGRDCLSTGSLATSSPFSVKG